VVDIRGESCGNNFLEYFTCTFEEGDGAIRFGGGVVGLPWFGNDNHLRFHPGVGP
jgi:hypothetical protein